LMAKIDDAAQSEFTYGGGEWVKGSH
jgi:hypothetical protein